MRNYFNQWLRFLGVKTLPEVLVGISVTQCPKLLIKWQAQGKAEAER